VRTLTEDEFRQEAEPMLKKVFADYGDDPIDQSFAPDITERRLIYPAGDVFDNLPRLLRPNVMIRIHRHGSSAMPTLIAKEITLAELRDRFGIAQTANRAAGLCLDHQRGRVFVY
jgi:hypothetical protein